LIFFTFFFFNCNTYASLYNTTPFIYYIFDSLRANFLIDRFKYNKNPIEKIPDDMIIVLRYFRNDYTFKKVDLENNQTGSVYSEKFLERMKRY